jgi:hypothetical protein
MLQVTIGLLNETAAQNKESTVQRLLSSLLTATLTLVGVAIPWLLLALLIVVR